MKVMYKLSRRPFRLFIIIFVLLIFFRNEMLLSFKITCFPENNHYKLCHFFSFKHCTTLKKKKGHWFLIRKHNLFIKCFQIYLTNNISALFCVCGLFFNFCNVIKRISKETLYIVMSWFNWTSHDEILPYLDFLIVSTPFIFVSWRDDFLIVFTSQMSDYHFDASSLNLTLQVFHFPRVCFL